MVAKNLVGDHYISEIPKKDHGRVPKKDHGRVTPEDMSHARSAFNALMRGDNAAFGNFKADGETLRYAGAWFIYIEDDGSLLAWVSLETPHEVVATRLVAKLLGVEIELHANEGKSMSRQVIAGPLTLAAYRATLRTDTD